MQLDPKALIEEAVQASIDAGLAVNGEYGVAAARHAARFMFNTLQAVQPVPVVTEDSMRAGWNACRKSIYAVCEDVQNEAERLRVATKPGTASEEQHAKGYYAGQHYAAKSIARGFNSMEAEDDDNFRAALTATASAEPVVTEDAHQFKNFHRLLCERFGYCHDEKDWRRDKVSLIEHIAALTAAVSAKPVAYTSQAQLDRLAEGKGGTIWSEPLPYHDDIALYAAPLPAQRDKADE